MHRRRSAKLALATTVALATPFVALNAPAAQAAPGDRFHIAKVLSSSFVGPLQFAVGDRLTFVADSFTSTLSTTGHRVIARGGNPSKGGDLAGVAVNPATHDVAYTWSNGDHSVTQFVLLHNGKRVFSWNLAAYEKNHNPDHAITYGAQNPTACQRKALQSAHIPIGYRGHVDSHPYATSYMGNHTWAVADAGANALLAVDTLNRRVTTIATMPKQRFVVTKGFAKANHLPDCVVGLKYDTEAVPTDVETGAGGALFVSTLPGGPEGPGTYPRGHILRVQRNGAWKIIGRGFADPTNIAINPHGTIYAAEPFVGRISVLIHGTPHTAMSLPAVVGLEWARGHLIASTAPALSGSHDPGRILKLAHN